MRTIITLLLAIFAVPVFSQQNNQPDTASPVYLNNVLRGTTILFGSDKNLTSRYQGYWLDSFNFTSCNYEETEVRMENSDYSDRISSIIMEPDSFADIEINIWENCGKSFLLEIEIIDDTILNLIYQKYGDVFACECCFGINYHVLLFPEMEQYKKLESVILNGESSTMRKISYQKK